MSNMRHQIYAKFLMALLVAASCAAMQQPVRDPAVQSVVDAARQQKTSAAKAKSTSTNDASAPPPEPGPVTAQSSPEEQPPEQNATAAKPTPADGRSTEQKGDAKTANDQI